MKEIKCELWKKRITNHERADKIAEQALIEMDGPHRYKATGIFEGNRVSGFGINIERAQFSLREMIWKIMCNGKRKINR